MKNNSSLKLLVSAAIGIICFLHVKTPVMAVNCSAVPSGGTYHISNSCTFANPTDGVDTGIGNAANTAVLVIDNGGNLTVGSGQTIAVGSITIISGGVIGIIRNAGAQIKVRTPIYMVDADGDLLPASTTQYTTSGVGRVRRNTLTSISAIDCNDVTANGGDNVWQNITGYADADGDGISVAGSTQVCSGAVLPSGYLASASSPADANDAQYCPNISYNPPGACNKCSVGAYAFQTASEDLFNNECTASYNACSGATPIGPDGNCNGAGACKTNGQTGSACATAGACQAGGGCSGGSCVSVYADNNSNPTYPINTVYDASNTCTSGACLQGPRRYSANTCTAGPTGTEYYNTSANVNCNPTYAEGQLKIGATCNGACNQTTTYYHKGCDPNNTYFVNAGNTGCSPTYSEGQLRTDWSCNGACVRRRSYYHQGCDANNWYWGSNVADSAWCPSYTEGQLRNDWFCNGACNMSRNAFHQGCDYNNYYLSQNAGNNGCSPTHIAQQIRSGPTCSGNVIYTTSWNNTGCDINDYWTSSSTCYMPGTCQSGGGCTNGSGSCNALVNQTTNWSAGAYGCGAASRCVSGICRRCDSYSVLSGAPLVWDDNSPNPSVAGQGGNVCWRAAPIGSSCDTKCAGYGGCVAANWNDSINWCDMCRQLLGERPCYATDPGPGQNYLPGMWTSNAACYWRPNDGSNNQTCSSSYWSIQRMCVCQW